MQSSTSIDTKNTTRRSNTEYSPPATDQRKRGLSGSRSVIPSFAPPAPPAQANARRASRIMSPPPVRHAQQKSVVQVAMQTELGDHLLDLNDTLIETLLSTAHKPEKPEAHYTKFLEGCRDDTVKVLTAAATGDIDVIEEMITSQEALDGYRDTRGKTALHLAAMHDQSGVIDAILVAGFDPNITDYQGSMCRGPLHDAVLNGSQRAAKALLDHKGYKIDAKDGKGHTALHYAAIDANYRLVSDLCVYGANLHIGTELEDSPERGENALQLSIRHSNVGGANVLLESAKDPTERQQLLAKPLIEVLYEVLCRDCMTSLANPENPLLVQDIVNKETETLKKEFIPLVQSLALFRMLFKHLGDTARYSDEVTGLIRKSAKANRPFATEIFMALQQLHKGSNSKVEPLDEETLNTSLHSAAKSGDAPNVTKWLKAGAKPNSVLDDTNNTPLHKAAAKGHASCVAILLKEGADANRANAKSNLAAHIAAKSGHEQVAVVLKDKTKLTACNSKGQTPFFVAAANLQTDLLTAFYTDGIINNKDESGDTVLHAVLKKVASEAEYLEKPKLPGLFASAEKIILFLIEKGANVHIQDEYEKTSVKLVEEDAVFKKCGIHKYITDAAARQTPPAKKAVVEEPVDSNVADLEEELRRMILEQNEIEPEVAQPQQPKSPPSAPRLIMRQTSEMPEGVTTLMEDLRITPKPKQIAPESEEECLKRFTEDLTLDELDDVRMMLSFGGRNPLHFIAEQPNFAPYEKLVRCHFSHPLFCKLLVTQESHELYETPLHLIAKHRNVAMLRCLLQSKHRDMREFLRFSGAVLTKSTNRNVFHYLVMQKDQNTPCRVTPELFELLEILIKLYQEDNSKIPGDEDRAVKLATDLDWKGDNLTTICMRTENTELINRVAAFITDRYKTPAAKK